ncbi:MAG: Phosphatidylethanolamine N-methyltransferase [Candidatus Amesbacteria bacterium GW2011_GWB1_47_26]|uniref:Phosphatidylethanolamine N-methyltransferase n=1 Tax=Candidatus Amesbacteria bacterium GW2011_GWC2_45_19 TaxID=1618366 RepID=A0A0G1M4N7_9BACT|nr:MAG: Phosphatidylethanolamine N-methyltransferase [Candidatus Amesbacteria bacterium GW2011_GWC2_45_19]KKU68630.1 MAG: Phosphatidylethanolamine N-methyltransferase [Microgenomates group bacterium GW2011_GWC1_47_20]KKU74985.1 MAG: Phosphatidylethanolamine N-methyltransferase [Candidatus Amesbacteria bacterium GW2011_GWB1_47_26]
MKSNYYNDPEFSYPKYWQGRAYEHAAEVMAIRRLLGKRHFPSGVDIGGGYGRLASTLLQFCDQLTLVEPSSKQRRFVLADVKIVVGTSDSTGLPASSFDFVSIIRVLHHLPNPQSALQEAHRLLKPDGLLLLEFANSLNIKSRIASFIAGHPISTLPLERRRASNIRRGSIPFVNHHPQSILKALSVCGFSPVKTLSVSNFRSPFLKKIIPLPILLGLESISQFLLSSIYFGPSIFILALKI